ncbi:MAG: M56 family metallopeptidase [Bacteroidales bacterium]|nr:M56 family metallopeptidase [Bacteroidales bacterium]
MTGFLIYLLKSTLLLAVFDAFFLLVMRRSGWFRFNRITLLAGSAACLLLPLIPFRVNRATLYSTWLEPVVVAAGDQAEPAVAATASGMSFSWQAFVLALYLLGALVALVFYLRSYGAMFRLLRRTPSERRGGYTLHLIAQETPSFSWLRHIVIARSDYERYPAILTHERAHVRCGHSVDLLLASLLTVLQWFNPLVWICRSELKLLHEYEADDFVLKQGIDATQYQLLLVKKAVGEKRFLLANGFNHAQLKNRITMMQTTTKAAWKKLFLLLLLPLLAGSTLLLAERVTPAADVIPLAEESVVAPSEVLPEPPPEEPVKYSLLEAKPRFQDGDAGQSFPRWVNENLKYPQEAVKDSLQGRVTLQFTIEKDGSVTDVHVLRGCAPVLDEEAIRVVSQSPKWTPGYINGEPVRVVYNFPVLFQLTKKK